MIKYLNTRTTKEEEILLVKKAHLINISRQISVLHQLFDSKG